MEAADSRKPLWWIPPNPDEPRATFLLTATGRLALIGAQCSKTEATDEENTDIRSILLAQQTSNNKLKRKHFKEHIWPDVVGSRRPPILCKCEQSRVTLPPGTTQELPHAPYNTIQCTMHHTMHHATAAYGANFPLLGGIHHTPYLEGSGGERSLEEITSCRERIHMSERMMEGGEKWIEHFLGWWWNWCAATISYLDFQVLNYVVLSYHLILVA